VLRAAQHGSQDPGAHEEAKSGKKVSAGEHLPPGERTIGRK
jgi:hypothetical protein